MSEFDEYIHQTEPGRREKAQAWQKAIGLKDVDGLKVSPYLIENAHKHIEGEMSIDEVRPQLKTYYESKSSHDRVDDEQEKAIDYSRLSVDDAIAQIAKFTSGLWQIHPFREGNTRTTAVFIIKYLRSMGFNVTNDLFAKKSWYFRNALVRANYQNIPKGISYDTSFLIRFFRNLLIGEHHELHNRDMHISQVSAQSISEDSPKCQIGTLKCTLEEMAVLKQIENNPKITQTELAVTIRKSSSTVKRITSSLVEQGILIRRNGRRNGWWEIKK